MSPFKKIATKCMLIVATLLTACVAPNQITKNTPANPSGENQKVDGKTSPSVPQNPPTAPVIIDNSTVIQKLNLPPNTIDGDAFFTDFRYENYLPSSQVIAFKKRNGEINIRKQSFANAFERELAMRNLNNFQYTDNAVKKKFPEYLVFKVHFIIYPEKYNLNNNTYYLQPNYTYRSKLNSYSTNRTYALGMPSSFIWKYTGDDSRLASFNVTNGEVNAIHKFGSSTSTSNRHAPITITPDKFRTILSEGTKHVEKYRTSTVVYYSGYAVTKPKVNTFKCGIPSSDVYSYISCSIDTEPFKYLIENFMGEKIKELSPKLIPANGLDNN